MIAHTHHHTETKKVINRLSRAIGHLEAIKRMVEEGRDCGDVLIQLAAVRSAINGIGKIILADHMAHCIADAIENGDREALDQFNEAIAKFLR
ncbi:MAG: metal-sensing transcriptional repressor [Clostridia bacterium]|nr:metal-sensing transcriptional repressor [Clostridia bacterium]